MTDQVSECKDVHALRQEAYYCGWCGERVPSQWEATQDDHDPASKTWGEIALGEKVLEVDPLDPAQMIGGPLDGRYLALRREADEFNIVLAKSGLFTYVAIKDHDGIPLGVYYWDGMTA